MFQICFLLQCLRIHFLKVVDVRRLEDVQSRKNLKGAIKQTQSELSRAL